MKHIRLPKQGRHINVDAFNAVLAQLKKPQTIYEVATKLKKDPKTMRHYFQKLFKNGHLEIVMMEGNRITHYKRLKEKIAIEDMAVNVGAFKKMLARKEAIKKEKVEQHFGILRVGNVTKVNVNSYHTDNKVGKTGKVFVTGSTLSSYI